MSIQHVGTIQIGILEGENGALAFKINYDIDSQDEDPISMNEKDILLAALANVTGQVAMMPLSMVKDGRTKMPRAFIPSKPLIERAT